MNTESAEDILLKYPDEVSGLGLALRSFLFKELKDIIEMPDVKANIIGYGYGPGYKESICVIIPSKKGIKLGFYKGAELHDPEKLLTGFGKVHKYVEIKSAETIKNKGVKGLLKEAVRAYKLRQSSANK